MISFGLLSIAESRMVPMAGDVVIPADSPISLYPPFRFHLPFPALLIVVLYPRFNSPGVLSSFLIVLIRGYRKTIINFHGLISISFYLCVDFPFFFSFIISCISFFDGTLLILKIGVMDVMHVLFTSVWYGMVCCAFLGSLIGCTVILPLHF